MKKNYFVIDSLFSRFILGVKLINDKIIKLNKI